MSVAIDKRAPHFADMLQNWELVTALLGGTRAMRFAGTKYLPKWPKEDQEGYDLRRNTAVLFPAFQRTVRALASKPFSRPVTFQDFSSEMLEWTNDIDFQGRNVDAFGYDCMALALGKGLGGILVEYPKNTERLSAAAVASRGLRPYWLKIDPEEIIDAHAKVANGKWVLSQVRFFETVQEEDGEWGAVPVRQIRVLRPGLWAVYRESSRGEWSVYENGTTTLQQVPFVPLYGEREGFMRSQPPLLELAHQNVYHWQSSSDQQTILHVARVPILVATGVDDDKWELTIGGGAATSLPENAKLHYVEHSGSAIQAGKDELSALEDRMRQAGAELLVTNNARITATQVSVENQDRTSILQRITQVTQDAFNAALDITAQWVGMSTKARVFLFNDFGAADAQEASAQFALAMRQAGELSSESLYREAQRRGIISTDITYAEERERIQADGVALGAATAPAAPVTQPLDPQALAKAMADAFSQIKFPELPAPASAPPPEPLDVAALADAIGAAISKAMPAAPADPMTAEALAGAMVAAFSTLKFPEAAPVELDVQALADALAKGLPKQTPFDASALSQAMTSAVAAIKFPTPNVVVQRGGEVVFTEDASGRLTGAKLQ